jgi:hypothetical protein
LPTDDQDTLCWKHTPNGKCNTKSTYKLCLQALFDASTPTPQRPELTHIQLLKDMWKDKQLLPRIKAFAWRLIRKAISTGQKGARYSKHISNLCIRCGLPEDDIHLFFTCSFARAAWFHSPWHIRSDVIVGTNQHVATVISNLLSQNHPNASITNIFTFLWCLWKIRNEKLFSSKENPPNQVVIRTTAIINSSQIETVPVSTTLQAPFSQDLNYAGPRIYVDAAW